jgi:stress response protein YsnF
MSKRSTSPSESCKTSKRPVRTESAESPAEPVVLPVARETIQVDKHAVETGKVTVQVVPSVRTEVIDLPPFAEHAVIEHVPMNRMAERPEASRHNGTPRSGAARQRFPLGKPPARGS